MKQTNKGFTLLQLLVVIIVFGVLATIALPNIFGAQRQERYVKKGMLTNASKQV